jgi:hypothetical protein
MFTNNMNNNFVGKSNSCLCNLPALIILILIILQFGKNQCCCIEEDDPCVEERCGSNLIGQNGILFIITLYFLSCYRC